MAPAEGEESESPRPGDPEEASAGPGDATRGSDGGGATGIPSAGEAGEGGAAEDGAAEREGEAMEEEEGKGEGGGVGEGGKRGEGGGGGRGGNSERGQEKGEGLDAEALEDAQEADAPQEAADGPAAAAVADSAAAAAESAEIAANLAAEAAATAVDSAAAEAADAGTEAAAAEAADAGTGAATAAERRAASGGNPAAGGGLMTFPDSLVKRIMKEDEEVKLITTEAVKLVSHCTVLFLESLAEQAWAEAQKLRKRKTVQEGDVVHAITGSLVFRQCVGTSLSAMREGLHAAAVAPNEDRPAGPPAKRQRKEGPGPKSKYITAFFLKS